MSSSDLISMLKTQKASSQDQVSMTVRMPVEMAAQVDGLAEFLNISRNETVLKLISPELEKVKKEIDSLSLEEDEDISNIDIASDEAKFFILNTNKGNNIEDHNRMVNNGLAEAFCDPWMFYIDKIKKNDVVFLYENGKGIVSYGRSNGVTEISNRKSDQSQDKSHFQKLENYTILENPIKASEIRSILGRNIPFLKTLIHLSDGIKLLKYIQSTKK
ncbi:hypothetical protein J4P41_15325 [Gluconobacter sp. NFX36]|uniref:hypothetical protein n=1 Tax=Gluconobacter sp. NFX36 TaxID=2819535 RepID=UPI003CEA52A9